MVLSECLNTANEFLQDEIPLRLEAYYCTNGLATVGTPVGYVHRILLLTCL
jgi:hypothetical protein